MTTSANFQMKSRPGAVTFAVLSLIAAFAIPPLRAAVEDGWTQRVGVIAIADLVLIAPWSIALLKAWKWAWWLTVLGLLLDALGVLFDLTVAGGGWMAQASPGLDRQLLGAQYVLEVAVLVLLLHPKARRWFGIGVAVERPTGGVA